MKIRGFTFVFAAISDTTYDVVFIVGQYGREITYKV